MRQHNHCTSRGKDLLCNKKAITSVHVNVWKAALGTSSHLDTTGRQASEQDLHPLPYMPKNDELISVCRRSSSHKHHLCCSSSGVVASRTSRGHMGRPGARSIDVQSMPQVHHLRLRLLLPPNRRQRVRHMPFCQRSSHRIMHRRPRQVNRDQIAPCTAPKHAEHHTTATPKPQSTHSPSQQAEPASRRLRCGACQQLAPGHRRGAPLSWWS